MSQSDTRGNSGIRAQMACELLNQNPDTPLIDIIDLLTNSTDVLRGSRKPWHRDNSTRITLMSDAVDDAGIETVDPDEVTQLYLPEEGLVIVDLKNNL